MAIATPDSQTAMGGYDYQFVEVPSPDWLMCNICHYPSKKPRLSVCCGNVFCESCLDGAKQVNISCPVCRVEGFETILHKQADRAVRSLNIFCSNKEKGCEWQGEVNHIENHLENTFGCQYADAECTNGCGKIMQRKLLNNHEQNECSHRKVNCKYCSDVGAYDFIVGKHMDLCLKYPIQCPNANCNTAMPRENINEHRKACQYEMVDCSNGCGLELQRRQINNHMSKKCSHRTVKCQYCHITGKHYIIHGDHKEQCQKFPVLCPNKCNLHIPRDNLAKHADVCPMKLISCEYFIVGCEKVMNLKDQKVHNKTKVEEHLSLTANKINSIQQEQAAMKQQLEQNLATFTATFQEALSKLETKFQSKVTEIEAAAEKKINELEIQLQKKTQQLEKMNISDWGIEIISNSTKLSFGDRTMPVVIKMSDYAKKKKDRVEWYSDYFYMHQHGYKICLRVHAAGWSKGCATHISVILCLLAGPFDDNQSWPLRGEFEVKLLNQISDTEHHSEVGTAYNIKRNTDNTPKTFWSRDQFISYESLQRVNSTCQFIKNDTIYFAVHTRRLQ